MIFNKLGIDTEAILEAAGTKWNFLPFRPGLVGGHCIGVDPYYLTHKAISAGIYPEMILSGRKLNDGMGSYIANQVTLLMAQKLIHIVGANILIMGLTFKENCPDLRNTRVVDLISKFENFGCNVDVSDPWVDEQDTVNKCRVIPFNELKGSFYDAIVLAVAHDEFKKLNLKDFNRLGCENYVLYDIKYILSANEVDGRL